MKLFLSNQYGATCSWINIHVDPATTFQSTNQNWGISLQEMTILALQPELFGGTLNKLVHWLSPVESSSVQETEKCLTKSHSIAGITTSD